MLLDISTTTHKNQREKAQGNGNEDARIYLASSVGQYWLLPIMAKSKAYAAGLNNHSALPHIPLDHA